MNTMVEIDSLKKSLLKKKEKIPLKPDMVESIAYLLETVPRANLADGKIVWKTCALDTGDLHFYQRDGWVLPPFHMAERNLYEQAKRIAADAPYAALALNGEDMLYANQLVSLNKDADVNFVLKHDLLTIVTYELAKKEIPLAQERKAQLAACSGKENIKRDLAMKLGVNYSPAAADEIKAKPSLADQLASKIGMLDKIITTTDEKEFMDTLKEKLSKDGVQQSLGVRGKTLEEMTGQMIRNGPTRESLAMLGIDYKSWKLKEMAGSLKSFVEEKLDATLENPSAALIMTGAGGTQKYQVGDRIVITPGRGTEYDCGGSISTVPSGAEGMIDNIDPIKGNYHLKFDKVVYCGNGWAVSPREARLLTPKREVRNDYGISPEVLDAIINGDFEKMISAYTSGMKKEMKEVGTKLTRLESYTSRFNTQR
jgi:hypothetical protein